MSVKYVRKELTAEAIDDMRINLSVMNRKLRPEPSCDFCGDLHPAWVYASSRLSTGERRQCWRWTACENCANDIEAGQWASIVDRIVEWLAAKFEDTPHEFLDEAAHMALTEFFLYSVTYD